MKLAYFSITGQTRRFIEKTGLAAYEITDADPYHEMGEPFILVIPTYDDEMLEPVVEFLGYHGNHQQLVGIAGGGNRNFNELYIHNAKDIAQGLNVPIVFDFEFNGTPADVRKFKKVVQQLESQNTRS
ncbi:ribonucleotide reductase stimulatory protein [Lapidilactobacillus gannanensis]|jgi:protein involved in ribonucleotide reduction|uniref:Ribonucleotide reductase stimulatory protein n=1 Tax=Lapidilactobacillus gannanensis TaxID=2486002 RepID=A0ABW4BK74_9LACO|nr:class Ib ribonucleoside-diphosphate reductase assembly flavoprotein NrdI [Lapidilactobacillus gannanensis]MCH4057930.1 class Ib ribonucleoside-diphosphate reductase assembly flavoprotein NrdI [Lactobacillaceae bacterium]